MVGFAWLTFASVTKGGEQWVLALKVQTHVCVETLRIDLSKRLNNLLNKWAHLTLGLIFFFFAGHTHLNEISTEELHKGGIW